MPTNRPFEDYFGGKGSLYQNIINQQAPHLIYFESHIGNGSVYAHKAPALVNIGTDLNPDVIAGWHRVTIENGGHRVTSQSAVAAVTDKMSGAAPPSETVMNAGIHRQKWWDRAKSPQSVVRAVASISALVDQLARIDDTAIFVDKAGCLHIFICGDASAILSAVTLPVCALVYADPPYPMETRNNQTPRYACEYTPAQHSELLYVLLQLECMVMVSSYFSAEYANALAHWHYATFTAYTRQHQEMTEWLWMNYSEPNRLHDYRYLGKDYRERETIKKMIKRQVKRFQGMPRLKRLALIAALEEEGLI